MKKYLIILSLALLTVGISSYQYADFKFLPTSLKVTVLDELVNPVEGAEVTLFNSKDDYRAHKNPKSTKVADESGIAVFKKLDPVSYFVHVDYAKKSNIGSGVKTETLREGRINKVNTIIK